MDTDTFDRLIRRFRRAGTRRSALRMLLGTALVGTSLGTAAAKPEPNGRGQANGKGKRRGRARAEGKKQGKPKPGNHCISPSGVDLNELFGISAQIVTPFCTEVGVGQKWVPSPLPWFVGHTFALVPEGFEPAGETPQEDFFAKFSELKIVIDPGTKHEKTVVFPNDGNLFADEFGGLILVIPITLGTVHPLRVGAHEVDVSWVFSAMHCDGRGDDPTPAVNCFPAGETRFDRMSFAVVPGHF